MKKYRTALKFMLIWLPAMAGLAVAGTITLLEMRSGAPPYDYWRETALNGLPYVTLGALILTRRPGNTIGRLFVLLGYSSTIQFLGGAYADAAVHSAHQAGVAPAVSAAYAGLVSECQQTIFIHTLALVALLFPKGRLLSKRWRVVATAAVGGIVVSTVVRVFAPGRLDSIAVSSPFSMERTAPWLDVLITASLVLSVVTLVPSVVSLILRFRRAKGDERLQMKWFTFAIALAPAVILISGLLRPPAAVEKWVWPLAFLPIPVAAGLAVMRYRLYEIDRVINRTIVYAALSGVLALGYVGLVVVLQSLFPDAVASSDLAIAGSTLLIAAAAGPLRRRIQSVVDRRFYRQRYDSAQSVAEFAARLRSEVELQSVTADLKLVIHDALSPAHTSMWLRIES